MRKLIFSLQAAAWLLVLAGASVAAEISPAAPRHPAAGASEHVQTKGRTERMGIRHRQGARLGNVARRTADVEGGAGLHQQIARHAQENGVPVSLANAVVRIESRYNARVVHAGNYGLMQIRPQTARGVGFTGPASALLNAETNLHYGMKYLAIAYRQGGGDTCRTVMRYQSGIGATRMSAANRVYCAKAKQLMAAR